MPSIVVPITGSGFNVPLETCERLGLQAGESVEIFIEQQATDAGVERQLEVAKRIMVKRREVLKRLAE